MMIKKNDMKYSCCTKGLFVLFLILFLMAVTFQAFAISSSEFWKQDSDGNWYVERPDGQRVKSAWLCDDVPPGNGDKAWYVLDPNGNLITAGLIRDENGNYFSIETNSTGNLGLIRYASGTYDGLYLNVIETMDDPKPLGTILNEDAIETLKAKYGVTDVSYVSNDTCIYTSDFVFLKEVSTASTETKPTEKSTELESRIAAALADGNSRHAYYSGISGTDAALADMICQQIADMILSDSRFDTDLKKVQAAAATIATRCSTIAYYYDRNCWYRSPYGVLVAGYYTCAGSTRTLGRVLEYMGYSWNHANENDDQHQWCTLTIDGKTGYADGMAGTAGYGAYSILGEIRGVNPDTARYEMNPKHAQEILEARTNGGTLSFYCFKIFNSGLCPDEEVGRGYTNDQLFYSPSESYSCRHYYTFNTDGTLTYHNHSHESCHPYESCSINNCEFCDGDIILYPIDEGTLNSVHYLAYKGTVSGMDGGSYYSGYQPEIQTWTRTVVLYDSGIMNVTEVLDGSIQGRWIFKDAFGLAN